MGIKHAGFFRAAGLEALKPDFSLAKKRPEKGVGEASQAGGRQRHGFVHRRVLGDAVQEEELVKSATQEAAQGEILHLKRGMVDNEVEARPPTDRAIKNLHRQIRIRALERGSYAPLDDRVGERPGFLPPQESVISRAPRR